MPKIESSLTHCLSQQTASPEKAVKLDTKSIFQIVTLLALACIGALLIAFSVMNFFGLAGTVGLIAMAAVGGALVLSSLTAIMYKAIKECIYPTLKGYTKPTLESPKAPPTPNPSTKLDKTECEDLERTFWQIYCEKHHTLFEMALNSGHDPKQCAVFIVDHFINYVKHEKLSFSLSDRDKDILIKAMAKQLEVKDTLPANCPPHRTVKLKNGTGLEIYRTRADGACGFHALLGESVNGVFQTDERIARKKFCDWIRSKWERNKLPTEIRITLNGYFLNFETFAHPGFRENPGVIERYSHHHKDYDGLTNDQQDQRKEDFISDEIVFEAYLNNLQDTSVYLLQDELTMAGECFGKQIFLHQPDWDEEVGRERTAYTKIESHILEPLPLKTDNPLETDNPSKKEIVHIWYNGYNHYERAMPASNL
jgi:hypothetical protein